MVIVPQKTHVNLTCFHYRVFLPVQEQATATPTSAPRRYSKDGQACSGAVAVIAILHRGSVVDKLALIKHDKTTAPSCADPSAREPSASKTAPPTTVKPGLLQSPASADHPRQAVFLHVAGVGDCRAVLCRAGRAMVLTEDHTPSVPSERRRVEAAGGFVARDRVNAVLGVSRAFGDILYKVRKRFACSLLMQKPCDLRRRM